MQQYTINIGNSAPLIRQAYAAHRREGGGGGAARDAQERRAAPHRGVWPRALSSLIPLRRSVHTADVLALRLQAPALGLIMVGDRKDSALYVRNKHAACRRAGIRSVNFLFPEGVSQVRTCS